MTTLVVGALVRLTLKLVVPPASDVELFGVGADTRTPPALEIVTFVSVEVLSFVVELLVAAIPVATTPLMVILAGVPS
jgi:hypothetical protein